MTKTVTLLLLICMASIFGYCQVSKTENRDSIISFVKRNTPQGLQYREELEQQVMHINEPGFKGAITGFFNYNYMPGDSKETYTDVLGYLFIPTTQDSEKFTRVLIDSFETEGNTPEIDAIFFANADKDKDRELVIILKWFHHHYQIEGYSYETRIYDNPSGTIRCKLQYIESVSRKVSGSFDGYREEQHLVSKFKTANEVKLQLKQLGY